MMNTEKQNEIPESNQVDVEQVADALGVPLGRVYCSAWDQPVYLKGTDSSRIASLPVEGIMQSDDGYLMGAVRVTLKDTHRAVAGVFLARADGVASACESLASGTGAVRARLESCYQGFEEVHRGHKVKVIACCITA